MKRIRGPVRRVGAFRWDDPRILGCVRLATGECGNFTGSFHIARPLVAGSRFRRPDGPICSVYVPFRPSVSTPIFVGNRGRGFFKIRPIAYRKLRELTTVLSDMEQISLLSILIVIFVDIIPTGYFLRAFVATYGQFHGD